MDVWYTKMNDKVDTVTEALDMMLSRVAKEIEENPNGQVAKNFAILLKNQEEYLKKT